MQAVLSMLALDGSSSAEDSEWIPPFAAAISSATQHTSIQIKQLSNLPAQFFTAQKAELNDSSRLVSQSAALATPGSQISVAFDRPLVISFD